MFWVGAKTPGGPYVYVKGDKEYKYGEELPPGVLSHQTEKLYSELGWVTDEVPVVEEDDVKVEEAPKEAKVEEPTPEPIEVQKEILSADEVPVQTEVQSGPRRKKRGKRK
jgi:hypothetical protein